MRVWHPPIRTGLGAQDVFPLFDLIQCRWPSLMSVVNTFTAVNRESAIRTAIVLNGQWENMLDVYPGMKENSKYDAFIVKKRRGIHWPSNYYNARGRAVDYQRLPRRSMQAMAAWSALSNAGICPASGGSRAGGGRTETNCCMPITARSTTCHYATENPEMLSNIAKAKRLAASNIPVTIVGETGTGSELFSRLMLSMQQAGEGKPFIVLNCGALPPTLIESTLPVAPIPARKIAGYLELANGGTLFLDELNAMPIEMQSGAAAILAG